MTLVLFTGDACERIRAGVLVLVARALHAEATRRHDDALRALDAVIGNARDASGEVAIVEAMRARDALIRTSARLEAAIKLAASARGDELRVELPELGAARAA